MSCGGVGAGFAYGRTCRRVRLVGLGLMRRGVALLLVLVWAVRGFSCVSHPERGRRCLVSRPPSACGGLLAALLYSGSTLVV